MFSPQFFFFFFSYEGKIFMFGCVRFSQLWTSCALLQFLVFQPYISAFREHAFSRFRFAADFCFSFVSLCFIFSLVSLCFIFSLVLYIKCGERI